MAAGLSTAMTLKPIRFFHTSDRLPKAAPPLLFTSLRCFPRRAATRRSPRLPSFTVCVLMEDPKQSIQIEAGEEKDPNNRVCESQLCISDFQVGMEFWARWAHRSLWHASLWHMHESHHRAREGPFELNDVFAIINAVPAIGLLSYGFFHKGLVPGLCFGAGLGITVFGMAYMFVHDGLVHRRFPVGPIANVPYFRRVAAAHHLHHTDKFNSMVPYGLFLGPREVKEVGGAEELEKEITRRTKSYKKGSS
ncbi:LOW QUALITY PROTEIN: beta-carotene 3-hydroxylase 1, chloroplastic-like [Neltuma alba]|uniref:LOW QUALITY PROTEIN: beta-carotene 3-hydroxylase 1, chloroplastic-like n=1 Tax=Neltuma alba TaxID=207710 RepID=UPI0010A4E01A|nr:LOW QUALITY PROTEIN: beta-carotene 3-hydroxylase 1, chloroplastic-like [Prosopis alba]